MELLYQPNVRFYNGLGDPQTDLATDTTKVAGPGVEDILNDPTALVGELKKDYILRAMLGGIVGSIAGVFIRMIFERRKGKKKDCPI